MTNYQSEYYQEKAEKEKLLNAMKKLTEQLHT